MTERDEQLIHVLSWFRLLFAWRFEEEYRHHLMYIFPFPYDIPRRKDEKA